MNIEQAFDISITVLAAGAFLGFLAGAIAADRHWRRSVERLRAAHHTREHKLLSELNQYGPRMQEIDQDLVFLKPQAD
jgi:DNA-binding transcriptional MocR family regulator